MRFDRGFNISGHIVPPLIPECTKKPNTNRDKYSVRLWKASWNKVEVSILKCLQVSLDMWKLNLQQKTVLTKSRWMKPCSFWLTYIGLLTIHGICSFWQLNGIWGVMQAPSRLLEITGRMTIKCLPDIKLNDAARNQKKIWYNLTGFEIIIIIYINNHIHNLKIKF